MDNEPPTCMYFEVNEMETRNFLGMALCITRHQVELGKAIPTFNYVSSPLFTFK